MACPAPHRPKIGPRISRVARVDTAIATVYFIDSVPMPKYGQPALPMQSGSGNPASL